MRFLSRLIVPATLAVGIGLLATSTAQTAPVIVNRGGNGGSVIFIPGLGYGGYPGLGYGGYPGGGYGYPGGGYGYPGGGYGYPGGGYGYPSGSYGNSGYGGYNYSTYTSTYSPPIFVFTPTITSRNYNIAEVKTEDSKQQAASYTPPDTKIATVEVRVPADAKVWFAGTPTDQTGDDRVFETPPLVAGKTYAYEVKAQWMKDGKPVEKTQTVQVRAGQPTVTTFVAN